MENNISKLGDLLMLIKYPSITEKSINLYNNRQYTFLVDPSLTKVQIKYILQNLFNVTIIGVNSATLPIKKRRVGRTIGKRANYKKVFITLKEGQSLTELLN